MPLSNKFAFWVHGATFALRHWPERNANAFLVQFLNGDLENGNNGLALFWILHAICRARCLIFSFFCSPLDAFFSPTLAHSCVSGCSHVKRSYWQTCSRVGPSTSFGRLLLKMSPPFLSKLSFSLLESRSRPTLPSVCMITKLPQHGKIGKVNFSFLLPTTLRILSIWLGCFLVSLNLKKKKTMLRTQEWFGISDSI